MELTKKNLEDAIAKGNEILDFTFDEYMIKNRDLEFELFEGYPNEIEFSFDEQLVEFDLENDMETLIKEHGKELLQAFIDYVNGTLNNKYLKLKKQSDKYHKQKRLKDIKKAKEDLLWK